MNTGKTKRHGISAPLKVPIPQKIKKVEPKLVPEKVGK
jgi:hypothetical protein